MAEKKEVGVRALREDLSRFIAEAKEGGEITIMSHGKPVATLTAAKPAKRKAPRFGALKGKIWMADDWDVWDPETLAAFDSDIFPPS